AVPGFAPAGCYPAPFVRGARTFLSGNLSVSPQRPSDRLTPPGMGILTAPVKGRSRLIAPQVPEPLSSWRDRGKKLLQGASRRGIGMAIDSFGAEMALKCGHDLQCGRVIVAIGLYPIPIVAQRFLQRDNGIPLRARRKHLAEIHDRCRLHPTADAGFVKRAPGKFLARVLLAGGRNIGMSQDSRRRNRNAGLNAAAER